MLGGIRCMLKQHGKYFWQVGIRLIPMHIPTSSSEVVTVSVVPRL